MRSELAELWRYRALLWQLVRRDLKVRYKNSRLGVLWSIAPPLMEVAVITFVLKRATQIVRFPSYSAFLLVAMIPWTYFQTALLDASQSILVMYPVIRKVYLPREVIPLSVAISNFIHFMLSWSVFFVYWWGVSRGPILWTSLLFPVLALVECALVTGLSLFVSCLNVFYEDIKYILTILMRLGIFILPIPYLAEQVLYHAHGRFAFLYYLVWRYNPLAALITGYRRVLLQGPEPQAIGGPYMPIDWTALGITTAFSLAVLVGGYAYFNARKWQFVERP